jgi:hypothetical protein
MRAQISKNQKQIEMRFDVRASWGAAVLRPYMILPNLSFGGRSAI